MHAGVVNEHSLSCALHVAWSSWHGAHNVRLSAWHAGQLLLPALPLRGTSSSAAAGGVIAYTVRDPISPPQVALYDTPGVTSAVRSREHGARVQGAWQVAQHCGVVLFMVDAARQVTEAFRAWAARSCCKQHIVPAHLHDSPLKSSIIRHHNASDAALRGGAVPGRRGPPGEIHTECRPAGVRPDFSPVRLPRWGLPVFGRRRQELAVQHWGVVLFCCVRHMAGEMHTEPSARGSPCLRASSPCIRHCSAVPCRQPLMTPPAATEVRESGGRLRCRRRSPLKRFRMTTPAPADQSAGPARDAPRRAAGAALGRRAGAAGPRGAVTGMCSGVAYRCTSAGRMRGRSRAERCGGEAATRGSAPLTGHCTLQLQLGGWLAGPRAAASAPAAVDSFRLSALVWPTGCRHRTSIGRLCWCCNGSHPMESARCLEHCQPVSNADVRRFRKPQTLKFSPCSCRRSCSCRLGPWTVVMTHRGPALNGPGAAASMRWSGMVQRATASLLSAAADASRASQRRWCSIRWIWWSRRPGWTGSPGHSPQWQVGNTICEEASPTPGCLSDRFKSQTLLLPAAGRQAAASHRMCLLYQRSTKHQLKPFPQATSSSGALPHRRCTAAGSRSSGSTCSTGAFLLPWICNPHCPGNPCICNLTATASPVSSQAACRCRGSTVATTCRPHAAAAAACVDAAFPAHADSRPPVVLQGCAVGVAARQHRGRRQPRGARSRPGGGAGAPFVLYPSSESR